MTNQERVELGQYFFEKVLKLVKSYYGVENPKVLVSIMLDDGKSTAYMGNMSERDQEEWIFDTLKFMLLNKKGRGEG